MLITFQTKTIVSFQAMIDNQTIMAGAYLRRDCTVHEDKIPGLGQG